MGAFSKKNTEVKNVRTDTKRIKKAQELGMLES